MQIIFAFEINRHGARAPVQHSKLASDGFKQQTSQLTAQGMRQRYLLGKYNYEKYANKLNLLSKKYKEGEIII